MKNKNNILTVASVGIGTFMSSLDSSAVNLAIPMIQKHFNISLSVVIWVVTAYLLVISSLLLTYGRIADMYGHKKVYKTGFVFFLFGSLLCGISPSIYILSASRVIQANGAGMLFSTGPAIITKSVAPENRGKALSVTAIAVALGLCAGPVIGGTLSALFGWQSIFYINLPIGLLGLMMARKNIPTDTNQVAVRFDVVGSVMIFAALLLILLPLNLSGDYQMPALLFSGLILAGLLLIVLFVLYERKCEHPMLKMSLFNNRIFSASSAAAVFMYMAQFVMVFLAPFYFEKLRGMSALHSGLLYLPLPIATMCIAPVSGSIADKFDSRFISTSGAVLMSCGLFMLSFLNIDSSYIYIVLSMVIVGLGFGMFQTPNNSSIMGNVPQENRGTASGILGTMRNVGMTIGIALSGALFSYFSSTATTRAQASGMSGSLIESHAFVFGLHHTFVIAAVVALIAAAASFVKGKVVSKNFSAT